MKKLIILVCMAASLMAVSSCRGPEGPMGPQGYDGRDGRDGKDGKDGKDGEDGQDGDVIKMVRDYEVEFAEDWQFIADNDGLNGYYYYECPFPELTGPVLKNGAVVAYRIMDNGLRQMLPQVMHLEDLDDDNEPYRWTETIYCDYEDGYITVCVRVSDFFNDYYPVPMKFRIIVLI